jgi:hypothetical protein
MSSSGAGGLRGRDTRTDDLAGSLGLSCVRGARRDVTEDGDTSDRGAAEDHHNALDGKVLQKAMVLAVAPAQTATRPAVAPKLRQSPYLRVSTSTQSPPSSCKAGLKGVHRQDCRRQPPTIYRVIMARRLRPHP